MWGNSCVDKTYRKRDGRMTEKRFIVAICGDGKLGIRDLTTLNEYTTERQVADYMNRVTKENEQLKARIEHLERKIQRERASAMKQHEKWENEIQKENEQLKSYNGEVEDYLTRLEEKNEQLKEENNALIKLINDLGNEEMDRQMEEILND